MTPTEELRAALQADGYRPATHAGIIDALLPTVLAYGERRAREAAAEAWDDGYATGWRETEEQPYSDHPARATWRPSVNPYRADAAGRTS